MKTVLNHFAYDIRPNTLELFIQLAQELWCFVWYRIWDARRCNIEQKNLPDIFVQIIEIDDIPVAIDKKTNTHIAFLSDSPKEDLDYIKQWCESKKVRFNQGAWSDRELWFDLPDIFVNFVIEIMHTSVVNPE